MSFDLPIKIAEEVECPKCGTIVMVNGEIDDLDSVGIDEDRGMGSEIQYEGHIYHNCQCGSTLDISVYVWEYPIGVINLVQVDHRNIIVD